MHLPTLVSVYLSCLLGSTIVAYPVQEEAKTAQRNPDGLPRLASRDVHQGINPDPLAPVQDVKVDRDIISIPKQKAERRRTGSDSDGDIDTDAAPDIEVTPRVDVDPDVFGHQSHGSEKHARKTKRSTKKRKQLPLAKKRRRRRDTEDGGGNESTGDDDDDDDSDDDANDTQPNLNDNDSASDRSFDLDGFTISLGNGVFARLDHLGIDWNPFNSISSRVRARSDALLVETLANYPSKLASGSASSSKLDSSPASTLAPSLSSDSSPVLARAPASVSISDPASALGTTSAAGSDPALVLESASNSDSDPALVLASAFKVAVETAMMFITEQAANQIGLPTGVTEL